MIETITTIVFLSAILFVAFSGKKASHEKSDADLAKERQENKS